MIFSWDVTTDLDAIGDTALGAVAVQVTPCSIRDLHLAFCLGIRRTFAKQTTSNSVRDFTGVLGIPAAFTAPSALYLGS